MFLPLCACYVLFTSSVTLNNILLLSYKVSPTNYLFAIVVLRQNIRAIDPSQKPAILSYCCYVKQCSHTTQHVLTR